MSDLLVNTERLRRPTDILEYASCIPYSTAAIALRIMEWPIDLRFGGSCIDQALIPSQYLPVGLCQLLWDWNKGHFANLIEGEYFDPIYHQVGLEKDKNGYYATSEGRFIEATKGRRGGYKVNVFSASELEKGNSFRRKREADFSFDMAMVNLPQQIAVDQVLGRISMYKSLQLLITHGFDPEGLMLIRYNPQRRGLESYIEQYGLRGAPMIPVDIDRAMEGLYAYSGVGYDELIDHFSSVDDLLPEVYGRLKHPRYHYY